MSERVPQSVLVVDDSADIHQLVRARLRSEGVTLLHAHNAEQGLGLALQHLPDLMLLDLEMPGIDGMALCRQIMEDPTLSAIPVIFLTGTIDVATKVQAFELGAVDYVTKPFDAIELKARVRAALRTKRYRDLLTTKAQIDALTGLWNRGYLDDRLAIEISVMARQGCPVSLIMMDIDHFKSINDTHGHSFGDLVIQRIAEVLGRVSRDSDIACRYGGEEFALILRNTPTKSAWAIAERLREEIAEMPLTQGRDRVRITASFGIAGSDQFDDPSQASPGTLLMAADKALYGAKSDGRNRVGARHPRG